MADTEFEVGGKSYRAAPLDARTCYHVARKFAPVLLWLAGMKQGLEERPPPERFGQAIVAVSGQIPREDADTVLDICLGRVSRDDKGGWAPIRAANGQIMFSDIDLPKMMEIVWKVVEANGLVDFFFSPDADSKAQS